MKNLPFFLFGLVAASYLASVQNVCNGNSGFAWLQAGSYAVYSLGEKPGSMSLGFDDCAAATRAAGNYSWRCIQVDGDHAALEVEINILINASVTYHGKEFVKKANNGDLSFIKRIPLDQVVGRIEVMPDKVIIAAPVFVHENLAVTVDLSTMELVDESGKAWGKWVMWINALKYPIEGETNETFIMNWLNTTVNLNVSYSDESARGGVDTVMGKILRVFAASRFESFENEFLLKLNIMMQPLVVFTYLYDARSGILLEQPTGTFLDDILTQKLGIVYTNGPFVLSETNVSIEEESEFDFSPFIPYLAIVGISGTIAGAYLIKKRRHSPQ